MKKKHKKKIRVLAVDPVVSDPTVLAKLDKERTYAIQTKRRGIEKVVHQRMYEKLLPRELQVDGYLSNPYMRMVEVSK